MATLVLGVVGRLVLGPVGGIVGTLLGGAVDRRLLGGGGGGGGARQANPEIQAASYGEPIPVVRGRMRVSGNIVWAAPIRETTTRSGGGKRGPATTSYSYSASFAVVLAARPIVAIGRVWADGKLLRDAGGQWLQPVTMRLHTGSERQGPDPLIAAAEGEATAFRGLAYAVFEGLPLAEFGNRLPNLSFELIADDAPVPLGAALAELAASAGVDLPVRGDFPEVAGLYLGAAAPLADALAPSLKASGAVLAAGRALVGPGQPALAIAPGGAADAHAAAHSRPQSRERHRRNAAASSPDAIELGYYDVDRDYQPGLQRARLRAGVRVDGDALPLALTAVSAKQLCHDRLLRLAAARQQRTLRLPWRFLGIMPGDILRLDDLDWQVRETRFERFVLTLELARVGAAASLVQPSDPGRALVHGDQAAGPTTLLALDLPPLPGELPDGPRLWIAGAGASAGWRRAGVTLSLDDGASFEPVGLLPAPVAIGRAVSILPGVNPAAWDRLGHVEVELLADSMWLESRSELAVLAGANLALLGDEIIQFATAEALGNRRFRLAGLLRGRRGTELAAGTHAVDEQFVLLDQGAMLALPLPLERQGQTVLLRATGAGDAAAVPVVATLGGAAIRPLLPVHLSWRREAGQLHLAWIAQSRAGFGWPDLADVPIGESRLAFRVALRNAAGTVAAAELTEPAWNLADQAGPLWLDVAQVGATLGPVATMLIP
jgi:Putative phage tail protein